MNSVLAFFRQRPYAFALLLCVVLLALNIAVTPSFADPARWPAILGTFAPFVLVGFACTPSVLSGGIDVSVGPLTTFVSVVFIAVLMPAGLGSWQFAIPILLVLATAVGAINGVLVAVVRLHPVVATVGMLFILIGLSQTIASNPVPASDRWSEGLARSIGIVPGAVITIGAAALIWFLLRQTAFVRNLLATGDSDISAYGSGINVTMIRILAYALGGLFAGIGGIALSALLQSSESSLATVYALLGLAAVVLGGTSLLGGRGGLLGTFLGALSIYLIQQLLTVTNVQPNLIQFAYGAVLIVGVLLSATLLSARSERKNR